MQKPLTVTSQPSFPPIHSGQFGHVSACICQGNGPTHPAAGSVTTVLQASTLNVGMLMIRSILIEVLPEPAS